MVVKPSFERKTLLCIEFAILTQSDYCVEHIIVCPLRLFIQIGVSNIRQITLTLLSWLDSVHVFLRWCALKLKRAWRLNGCCLHLKLSDLSLKNVWYLLLDHFLLLLFLGFGNGRQTASGPVDVSTNEWRLLLRLHI